MDRKGPPLATPLQTIEGVWPKSKESQKCGISNHEVDYTMVTYSTLFFWKKYMMKYLNEKTFPFR